MKYKILIIGLICMIGISCDSDFFEFASSMFVVEGTVTDESNGLPINNITVLLLHSDEGGTGQLTSTKTASGQYYLDISTAPTSGRLFVRFDGGADHESKDMPVNAWVSHQVINVELIPKDDKFSDIL